MRQASQRARQNLLLLSMLVVAAIVAGCSGMSSNPADPSPVTGSTAVDGPAVLGSNGADAPRVTSTAKCSLPTQVQAVARGSTHLFLVGVDQAQQLAPATKQAGQSVSLESPMRSSASAGEQNAHFDIVVCTPAHQPLEPRSVPRVRLEDATLGVTMAVKLSRLRSASEDAPVHFGRNIAVVARDKLRVTVSFAGDSATATLIAPRFDTSRS